MRQLAGRSTRDTRASCTSPGRASRADISVSPSSRSTAGAASVPPLRPTESTGTPIVTVASISRRVPKSPAHGQATQTGTTGTREISDRLLRRSRGQRARAARTAQLVDDRQDRRGADQPRGLGVLAPVYRREPISDAAWAALMQALPARFHPHRLRAFMGFCAAKAIAPSDLGWQPPTPRRPSRRPMSRGPGRVHASAPA